MDPSLTIIKSYSWILQQCGSHRRILYLSMLLSGVSAILRLVPMLCIYQAGIWVFEDNSTLTQIPEYGIFLVCLLAVLSVVCRFLAYFWSMKLSHIAAFETLYDLRMRLGRHLAKLPLHFFHTTASGGVKKAMSEDVEFLELVMGHYLPDLVPSLALPFFSALVLFWVNPVLAIVCLLPLPVALWMHKKMDLIYRENIKKFHDNLEQINNTIVEYIRGIKVIKAFNIKAGSVARYKNALDTQLSLAKKWNKEANLPAVVFRLTVDICLFLLLPTGYLLLTLGSIEVPELILFFLVGAGIIEPVNRIIMIAGFLNRIKEGMLRIQAIFDQPILPESGRDPGVRGHDIVFEKVDFSYNKYKKQKKVIDKLSFCLPQNSVTGFVGPSGAGKTTAAQLIGRFMEIDAGSICIGGQDIRQIPLPMLMDLVSFVFQDVFLMNDTVMENIRMGKKHAPDHEIVEAAKKARAHEFISGLEYGYDTVIGENGAFLSGGEKQRIAIARAVLKNTPILIFDEATAFTDPENESRIHKAIRELSKDKTVIIIAHRLASVMNADQLLLFDKGKIRAFGTHNELLKDSLYCQMWETFSQSAHWRMQEKEIHHG